MPWVTLSTHATGYLYTAANLNDAWTNINYLDEVAYAETTSDVLVTATTVGGANQILSTGAITYENVPHMIEFSCPQVGSAAVTNFVVLRDATTVLGTFARFAASTGGVPLHRACRITPTAASHTYNFAGWNGAAGTWTYNAGTGGVAGDGTTDLAMWMRITRVPT